MSENYLYKKACEEIKKIIDLYPEWVISNYIEEEEIDIFNASLLYFKLKQFRQQLELDNRVIPEEEDTNKIIEDGMRIHSLIIKEEMYGED